MGAYEGGYTLITVVVVLSVFAVISLQFMDRTVKSIQVSGYSRDSTESLLLAESAMNTVYGSFIYGVDFDGDTHPDNVAALDIQQDPPVIPLAYMYYVSGNTGVDQTAPTLLQRVADGEATALAGRINGHAIAATTNELRISNLFDQNVSPLVFEQDKNNPGNITRVAKTWEQANGTRKAAGWLELVKNQDSGAIEVYAEATAQVGNAKSYVQRYAGVYSNTLGKRIGALNEANPESRRDDIQLARELE